MEPEADDTADEKKEEEDDGKPKLTLGGLMQVTSRTSFFENAFFENFAKFWRARSRLYQNEFLQENVRSTAFFKLYKMCTLLHT